MFDEPLALLSLLATLGLLVVSWRAADAAKLNADVAAREFRLLRRPLVDVKWTVTRSENDENAVILVANVTEATGVPTMLHCLEVSVRGRLGPHLSETETESPAATLSGDVATHFIRREFRVPPPWLLGLAAAGPDNAHRVAVADLDVKVVISLADDEADEEIWRALAVLIYDVEQDSFLEPVTVSRHLPRLSRRTRGPRSRIVDPVLGAWERFWDSVH